MPYRCAEFLKEKKEYLYINKSDLKKIAAIGLLLLLLYNMFGLTVAMLFFEENYQSRSNIIIEDKWKVIKIPTTTPKGGYYNETAQESLIRSGNEFYNIMHEYYESDTLYVILKSNQNAQERFSELTALIQGMVDSDASNPQSALGKIIKLLGGLQKIYLPNELLIGLREEIYTKSHQPFYKEPQQFYARVIHLLHFPPPELT